MNPLQPLSDAVRWLIPHQTTLLFFGAILVLIPLILRLLNKDESVTPLDEEQRKSFIAYLKTRKWGILICNFIAFFYGLILITASIFFTLDAVRGLPTADYFTIVWLFVLGAILNMQPARSVPWSPVVGVVVGWVAASYMMSTLAPMLSDLGTSYSLFGGLVLIFSVVAWIILRYIEDWITVVGRALGATVPAAVVAGVALLQALLLLFGFSLEPIVIYILQNIQTWIGGII